MKLSIVGGFGSILIFSRIFETLSCDNITIMKGHGINYGIQEMSYFYRVSVSRSGLDTPIFIK